MLPQSSWQWQVCQQWQLTRSSSWNLGTEESAKPHLAGSRQCQLCTHQAIGVRAAVSGPFYDEGEEERQIPENLRMVAQPWLALTLWTGVAKFTLELLNCEMQLFRLLLLPYGNPSEATPSRSQRGTKDKNSLN